MLFESLCNAFIYIISCYPCYKAEEMDVRSKPRYRLNKWFAHSFRGPSLRFCWLSTSLQCSQRFVGSLPRARYCGKCFICISLFLNFEQLITLPFHYRSNWSSVGVNLCLCHVVLELRCVLAPKVQTGIGIFLMPPCPSTIANTSCELTEFVVLHACHHICFGWLW